MAVGAHIEYVIYSGTLYDTQPSLARSRSLEEYLSNFWIADEEHLNLLFLDDKDDGNVNVFLWIDGGRHNESFIKLRLYWIKRKEFNGSNSKRKDIKLWRKVQLYELHLIAEKYGI